MVQGRNHKTPAWIWVPILIGCLIAAYLCTKG